MLVHLSLGKCKNYDVLDKVNTLLNTLVFTNTNYIRQLPIEICVCKLKFMLDSFNLNLFSI